MKKLLWLITMCLAGLGGYHLGQQPNSPDVFGWMNRKVGAFQDSGKGQWLTGEIEQGRRGLKDLFDSDGDPPAGGEAPPRPSEPSTYAVTDDPNEIPRCW